jgi:hypothetical protein
MSSVQFPQSNLSSTATVTANSTKTLSLDSLTATSVGLTADASVSRNVGAVLGVTAGITTNASRLYTVGSSLRATVSFTAKAKKSNAITDHDIVFYAQIMDRPWDGELLQRKWTGQVATARDESSRLGSKEADGILAERSKFASLAQRRWEGMLL